MSVHERWPGGLEATEHQDEMRDLGGRELAGRRTGGRDRPDREPCPPSRLERELRSADRWPASCVAHQTLTRELRARGSARRDLVKGGLEGTCSGPRASPGTGVGTGCASPPACRRAVTGFAAAIIRPWSPRL